MPGIIIHTDGSCHGNPGPGGYAAIIQIPRHDDIRVQGHDPSTTNNRMEMKAVIEGLAHLGQLADIDGVDVDVGTDSEYVCNGFNKGWLAKWQQNDWRTGGKKAVANRELWEELLRLTRRPNATFTHVRGHAGDPMNELCDRIANEEALKARTNGSEGRGSWSRPRRDSRSRPKSQRPARRTVPTNTPGATPTATRPPRGIWPTP